LETLAETGLCFIASGLEPEGPSQIPQQPNRRDVVLQSTNENQRLPRSPFALRDPPGKSPGPEPGLQGGRPQCQRLRHELLQLLQAECICPDELSPKSTPSACGLHLGVQQDPCVG